jgi:hypothetical protein
MKNSSGNNNVSKVEAKQVPTNANNKNQIKSNNKNHIQEEIVLPPPKEKEKNLERFIHVTTYYDHEAMQVLKEVFEKINREAFNLKSVKEIYTKTLTVEEQDDNNLDYISGLQLIDNKIRITIIEGISNGAMKYVKEKLPKIQINDNIKKIFSNSGILFNKRIYSKFNLSLKFIKLRDNLSNILNTFDIYMKANKYKEIYNSFMNFGFILQSKTFSEIAHAELFPPAESLLLLERKYADILNDEDMTGLHTQPKKKKKLLAEENMVNMTSSINSNLTLTNSADNSKSISNPTLQGDKKRSSVRIKLESFNSDYDKHLELRNSNLKDFHQINIDKISKLEKRNKSERHFCRFNYDKNTDNQIQNITKDIQLPDSVYLYSCQKNNYYNLYVRELAEKIKKDPNNFYTYSKDYLTLSFPMVEPYVNNDYSAHIKSKQVKIIKYIT